MVALADLQPASFRGVRFLVPKDTTEEGRNIIKHQYPDGARYVEDNGYCPPEFMLTMVIHGAGLMSQFNALRSALNKPGPGTLQHPWYGAQFCNAEKWKVTREDTDSGVLTLECKFFVTTPPLLPAILSAIPAMVTGMSAALIGAAFASFTAQFGAPSMSVISLGIVSNAITSVASTFSTALGAAEGVATSVRHLVEQPEYLISDATALGAELETMFRGAFEDTTYTGSQIVTGLVKVDAAIDAVEYDATVIVPTTLDYAVRQEALFSFSTFCRIAGVSAMAEAMAGATYATAEQVEAAKELLLTLYAKVRVDGVPSEIGRQISEVVSAALAVLQQQELQLPRIDTIAVRPDMPASVLAYQLYDTDERTGTIIDLNLEDNPLLIEREARILVEA